MKHDLDSVASGLFTGVKKIASLLSRDERRAAWVLLGLTVIGMLLETLGVGFVVPAVALLVKQDLGASYPQLRPILEAMGSPTQVQLVIYGMVTLVAIYLIKGLFLAFLAWRQLSFALDVRIRLSQRLLTLYLRQPYTFHLQRNSSELMRNVGGEIGMVAGAIQHVMSLTTEVLVLSAVIALLLLVQPVGALVVVLVVGGVGLIFQRATRGRITSWGALRQHHSGLAVQHLVQSLAGAKDVKLLGREKDFIDKYGFHNIEGTRVVQLQAALTQYPRLGLELLAVAGMAMLVFIMLAQHRSMEEIVPTLGLFAVATFRIMPAVNRILGALQTLRFSMSAINTVTEEFNLPSPDLPQRIGRTPELTDSIKMRDVHYTYPAAASPALRGISITVRKGESVGFIGPSGSGKSTLVDVLLGLLTPTAGEILLDGVNIRDDMRGWQDQIGYVPQFIYLTDDTIRRNVAFGIPAEEIDGEAVLRAIRAAQLDEFVASLPDGVDTVVGERGVRLSGGQRQRIGMARALYHNPAVLVLDEATSALDSATERELMEAVIALQASKTVLIVAHRLSTVAHCDRLYRIEEGTVVEEGVPGEILNTGVLAGHAAH